MSIIHSQSFDQTQNSDIGEDYNLDNDDLVTFKHDSKTINFYYSQLTKYSKHIRDSYLFSDVIKRVPQEIQKFQEDSQLLPESVDYFFQLLQQNYNITEDSKFTYIHCIDLLKISKFLEVRKLSIKIKEYIKSQKVNVDFVIQMINYDLKTQNETNEHTYNISQDIEYILTSKINECLSNEQFKELPIPIIYRIVSKSSPNSINSSKLFDIIMKSIKKFCILFPFLDLEKLSEDQLDDLCEKYSNSDENTQTCFSYLKCNLNLIRKINKSKKNLEETNDEQKNKMDDLESKIASLQKQFSETEKTNNQLQTLLKDSNELINKQQSKTNELESKISSLQTKFSDSERINNQLQKELKDSNELNTKQQSKTNELESKISSLQKQFNDSERINNQLQKELKDSNELNTKQQSKTNELENQVKQLQKQLDEIFLIQSKIQAKVENGLYISAEINLIMNNSQLDTSKSKYIFSTSGEKSLGSEAYEKGEPVTSLHMKTSSYMCRPGTYFVRCIVFNRNGVSSEIVSNSVTTSGICATFSYKGEEPTKISLYKGRYKLEVWGAKGGDSTGKGFNGGSGYNRGNQSTVQGGLGGYSRGILNLQKNETVYVYVGGQGRPSDSSEGSSTKGGFPDGGGTKTGHCDSKYPTVPGTGGGSTSIRIGSDTNYTRVIVAGGGGGASGGDAYADPGGFGGGQSGGNVWYRSQLQSQGAGTQTGSTRGLGECDDRHGDPGQFGLGATGKYCLQKDSGGGGGGGWYGGGSGGYGNGNWCSSGGGGSGWTFTESSHKNWQEKDPSNASKFVLTSTYYLTDAVCIAGDKEFPKTDGNGTECGHNNDGYAKITPL